jgi:hypothetical protein
VAGAGVTLAVFALATAAPVVTAAGPGVATKTTGAGETATTPASTGTGQSGVVPPPPGSACGQTIDLPPRRSLGLGPAPLAIGDSVLYDAAQPLAAYGFHVNAMVCRTMAQGITWLEDHARGLPVLVVVALGTNGAVTETQIGQLLGILGPHRFLALVTPHDGNYAYVPGLMRAAARRYPDQIELLDWDRLSAGHPDWFAADGIHLGGTTGIHAYAQLVASALLGSSPSTAPASQAPSRTIRAAPAPKRRPARADTHRTGLSERSVGTALAAFTGAEAVCLSLVGG